MTVSTVPMVLDRINYSEPDHPIAVFVCASTKSGCLNSMFADTVFASNLIEDENPNLVGIYHRGMRPDFVREKLYQAISNYQGMFM